MTTTAREVQLLQAMAKAKPSEQVQILAELDEIRRTQGTPISTGLDFATATVASRLAPGVAHSHHTAATDWIDGVVGTYSDTQVTHSMRTEATVWFNKVSAEVKADREEFGEQAMGMAVRTAGAYGELAPAAQQVFLSTVAQLHKQAESPAASTPGQSGNAASGLPVAPPAEGYGTRDGDKVLDNFQPLVDPINEAAVAEREGEGSMAMPVVQENAQDPVEKAAVHRTAGLYAEVDLPGVGPTTLQGPYELSFDSHYDTWNVYALMDGMMTAVYGTDSEEDAKAWMAARPMLNADAGEQQALFASKLAAESDADQSGQAASSLPIGVDVNSEGDTPMWPWELDESGKNEAGAADVAGVATPGGAAGYPQPTASRVAITLGDMDQRPYDAECPNASCSAHGVSFVHDDLSSSYDNEGETAYCPECDTPLVFPAGRSAARTAADENWCYGNSGTKVDGGTKCDECGKVFPGDTIPNHETGKSSTARRVTASTAFIHTNCSGTHSPGIESFVVGDAFAGIESHLTCVKCNAPIGEGLARVVDLTAYYARTAVRRTASESWAVFTADYVGDTPPETMVAGPFASRDEAIAAAKAAGQSLGGWVEGGDYTNSYYVGTTETDISVEQVQDNLYGSMASRRIVPGLGKGGSRRVAADGSTCGTCGDKIAKDPSGENPSTWHHDNGEKHDHEAKPGGTEASRRTAGIEFWSTPGHGFLGVPISEYPDAGRIARNSPYSWTSGGIAWLEEDGDAPEFLNAHPEITSANIIDDYHEEDPPGRHASKVSHRRTAHKSGLPDSERIVALADSGGNFSWCIPCSAAMGYIGSRAGGSYIADNFITLTVEAYGRWKNSQPHALNCEVCGQDVLAQGEDHWISMASGKPRTSSFQSTAGVFCKTHDVWVGDGNASTHTDCSKEQRATEKTKEASGDPLDNLPPMGQPPAGWAERQDPSKPSYSYETGPDGHRDCDHASDYCQYTPNNSFVPNTASRRHAFDDRQMGEMLNDAAGRGSTTCGIHGDDTSSGRCATCDSEAAASGGWPITTAGNLNPRQAAFRRRVQANLASRRPFVREAMPSPAELNVSVGDIFYGSWGYDQTNVNFYEVTGLTGASVRIREVGQVQVGDSGPSESVMPDKGNYIGPEMTKRLKSGYQGSAAIKVNDVISAWAWDGKPKHRTGYGWGH